MFFSVFLSLLYEYASSQTTASKYKQLPIVLHVRTVERLPAKQAEMLVSAQQALCNSTHWSCLRSSCFKASISRPLTSNRFTPSLPYQAHLTLLISQICTKTELFNRSTRKPIQTANTLSNDDITASHKQRWYKTMV